MTPSRVGLLFLLSVNAVGSGSTIDPLSIIPTPKKVWELSDSSIYVDSSWRILSGRNK